MLKTAKKHYAFVVLGIISIVWHSLLLRHLKAVLFPDSKGYVKLADDILNWDWNDFHFRTPGYSSFIAVIKFCSGSLETVSTLQLLMSVSIPLMLYFLFFRLCNRSWMSGICALTYFFDWPSQAMSAAILSESLTLFLVLLSSVLLFKMLDSPGWILSICAGFTLFYLIMVRPAFLPIVPASCALMAMKWYLDDKSLSKRRWAYLSTVSGLPLIFLVLWGLEMKRESGVFTISHITGVALFNQVSEEALNFDYPENPALLKRLNAATKEIGFRNSGWKVVIEDGPLGWKTADAMKELSVAIIKARPEAYVVKVISNIREFWVDNATYVYSHSSLQEWVTSIPALSRSLKAADSLYWLHPGRILKTLALFAILAIVYIVSSFNSYAQKSYILLIMSVILVCMFGHVLVNGADLARYRMPIQTLYLATYVYLVLNLLQMSISTIRSQVQKRKKV